MIIMYVLNWGPYANGSYMTHAVPNLVKIGKLVGSSMHEWLTKEVFKLNELHIVGHSLGAHLGAYITRAVSTLSKYEMKIQRLTGLDPALPLFYPKVFFFPTAISADDAVFVDVIHTDAGSLGAPNATGTVDFWPNGGLEQPGCINSTEPHCNHCRSWHFWSESLEHKFFAVKCENFWEFKQNNCDGKTVVEMGINSQFGISGNFYLQTSSTFPYSLGMNDRPTVVYCFGYTENYTDASTQLIVDAYLSRNDHNILVIQWSMYAANNYFFQAIPNTIQLGAKIGKVLVEMQKVGFNLKTFHIVGHSLGGQLAGFIGRSVIENSKKELIIPRITALDPAGPVFYPETFLIKPLNVNDAKFVDVIHTDADHFGTKYSTGHVDFWPNEGNKNQPNCPTPNLDIRDDKNYCSHRRSWVYFAESVVSKDPHVFHAIPCNSWNDFVDHKCNNSIIPVYMGIGADPNLKGNFYLQTNPTPPYNRNENGAYYTKLN
ncbi:unnamed protein product [Diamesa hyperborea]